MAKNKIACVLALALCASEASAADSFRKLVLTRNYSAAAALLQQQAAAGKPEAQFQLGIFYRNGIGVKRDATKALQWLKRAAAAGSAEAKLVLVRTIAATQTDGLRDGIIPPPSGPLLPLQDVAHLPQPAIDAPGWLHQVTARNLATPDRLATNVNAPDLTGETALAIAARLNHPETVQALLARGADPNLADKRGTTPLMWAARNGNVAVIEMLSAAGSKADARATTLAATFCKQDAIAPLVKAGVVADMAKINAIMTDRCPNYPQLRQAQTDDKPEPDKPDSEGFTALHLAAAKGDTSAIASLLTQGATAEALTPNADTPLMLAAATGQLAAVKALLPRTSDVNLKNFDGETALYLAVKAGAHEAARALIEAGASPDSRTITRDTPKKIAARSGSSEMVALLGG